MPKYKKYINPLFEELDAIVDFSNIETKSSIYKEEYPHLEDVTRILDKDIRNSNKKIEKTNEELERILVEINTSTGDDKADSLKDYNQHFTKLKEELERINLKLETINSPYFGKITFNRKANKHTRAKTINSYIGKFSIFHEETKKVMVTDWRAPIANLYYENTGPTKNVSFLSPNGKQEGDLELKRQFEINRARINNVYEAKTGNFSADQFLISQLEKRTGDKLTDIVATIQKKQNKIIREEINKPVIVQGVAGSGKTTLLLHKLAYILFTYSEEIDTKNSIIIAPNKMFLDYISELLPSLGIREVEHNTFLFWSKNILGWNDYYLMSSTTEDEDIKEYKGTYKFKQLLEEYFKSFEKNILENIPSTLKHDIIDKYYSMKKEHPYIALWERLELSLDYAVQQRQFKKNLKEGYVAPLGNMEKKIKEIKDYLKKKTNVYRIYRYMFDHIDKSDYIDNRLLKKFKEEHKKHILTQQKYSYYHMEDLPPLLWLHFQIHGLQDHLKDYVLVDEAQDLTPFQIIMLKKIAKKGNITLAGDLNQAIHPPFHIREWKDIIEKIKSEDEQIKEVSFHQLHRCYRTTIEIINFANKIFKKHFPEEFNLPKAVLRHGEDVKYIETKNNQDIEKLIEVVNNEFEKNISTLAIICRNEKHANEIYDNFTKRKKDIQRRIIHHDENNYEGGLLILPIEKTKGLEFDSVIVAEMTQELYKPQELDTKLLYVAITRALHRLYIHTVKEKKKSKLLDI